MWGLGLGFLEHGKTAVIFHFRWAFGELSGSKNNVSGMMSVVWPGQVEYTHPKTNMDHLKMDGLEDEFPF